MTIRFLVSQSLVFSSAALAMMLSSGNNIATAYPQFSMERDINPSKQTKLASNLSFSTQQQLISLRIPFFSGSKKKKPSKDVDSNSFEKEYIFRAPQAVSQKQNTSYQVQVYGDSSSLLEKVQAIEPKAFLKGNLIQVGVFSEQQNAETLLQKLALEGFWARILVNRN